MTADTLKLGGALNWNAGVILANSATTRLTVLPAGVIDFRDNGTAFANNVGVGTLDNQGILRKSAGTGTTTVGWAVINTGVIDSQAGTLTFSNGVTSNEGGLVRGPALGVGNYGGNQTFNSGSTLAPGGTASAGRLVLNGNLVMNNESTFHVNLNTTTVTTGYDRLLVNGTVALNNNTLAGSTTGLTPGSTLFFILVNDGTDAITGTFAGAPNGSTITLDGFTAVINYNGNFDAGTITGGNDIVLHSFTPVPEPGSVLAVAAGGLGAVGMVRRWRRGASL